MNPQENYREVLGGIAEEYLRMRRYLLALQEEPDSKHPMNSWNIQELKLALKDASLLANQLDNIYHGV